MTIEDSWTRYLRAANRMQTGTGLEIEPGTMFSTDAATPKQLRVGVNSALANQGGLAKLLIAKGVITEEEYAEAMADAMEAEADGYEERLNAKAQAAGSQTQITLG